MSILTATILLIALLAGLTWATIGFVRLMLEANRIDRQSEKTTINIDKEFESELPRILEQIGGSGGFIVATPFAAGGPVDGTIIGEWEIEP